MASYNFKLNRDEAIEQAYGLIGVGVAGEPLDATDIDDAQKRLNLMLKAWQGYGIKLWKRKSKSITLIASQAVYTLGQKAAGTATTDSANKLVDTAAKFINDEIAIGDIAYNLDDSTSGAVTAVDNMTTLSFATDLFPDGDEAYEISSADVSIPRPLRIIECSRKDTNNKETTITPVSLSEYDALPNKSSTGTPVNYFYDPTLGNGTFYLWPAPGTTAAAEYTVELIYNEPIADMDNSTDDFDFPQEWLEAVTYGLAYRLAPVHGLPQSERTLLRADMELALELARDFDVEVDSVYFAPNYEGTA